jgi:hypothetical protein
LQLLPLAHGEQLPPQSTSLSLPSFTPSVQLAALQTLAEQSALAQSLIAAHALPTAHFGQDGPPQSTSVSPAFFTPSVQVAAQVFARHSAPLQSASFEQPSPVAHTGHGPPQSTSVSPSFWMPSAHVPAWHMLPEQITD